MIATILFTFQDVSKVKRKKNLFLKWFHTCTVSDFILIHYKQIKIIEFSLIIKTAFHIRASIRLKIKNSYIFPVGLRFSENYKSPVILWFTKKDNFF